MIQVGSNWDPYSNVYHSHRPHPAELGDTKEHTFQFLHIQFKIKSYLKKSDSKIFSFSRYDYTRVPAYDRCNFSPQFVYLQTTTKDKDSISFSILYPSYAIGIPVLTSFEVYVISDHNLSSYKQYGGGKKYHFYFIFLSSSEGHAPVMIH